MSSYQEHDHPFYGEEIVRTNQQEYINEFLKKYENDPVNEDLKKKIWDDLQMEKYYGRVTIPFKVILRRDSNGLFPDYIEVIIDTKV